MTAENKKEDTTGQRFELDPDVHGVPSTPTAGTRVDINQLSSALPEVTTKEKGSDYSNAMSSLLTGVGTGIATEGVALPIAFANAVKNRASTNAVQNYANSMIGDKWTNIPLSELEKITGFPIRTREEAAAAAKFISGTPYQPEQLTKIVKDPFGKIISTEHTPEIKAIPGVDISGYRQGPMKVIKGQLSVPYRAGVVAHDISKGMGEDSGAASALDYAAAASAAAAPWLPKKVGKIPVKAIAEGIGLIPVAKSAYEVMKPEQKAAGGLIDVKRYAGGKQVVEGGRELAKKLFVPKPTQVLRASEALGQHEGKYLIPTQADRMRSTMGDLGGPGFSKFQLEDPRFAGAAWAVGNKGTATGLVNQNKLFPEGKAVWSPLIGEETQHRSNQHVYDMLTDEFNRQAAAGKLTPELRERINQRLSTAPIYQEAKLGGIDIANPEHLKEFGDTFARRAAIADVIGGKGVGGTKGSIVDYPGIMQEMTDPMVIGAPTHSVGTRLFTLSNEVEHNPELHSAFPYVLKGEDLGVAFNPVPKELALPTWINTIKDFTGRAPGYMEFTRGIKGQGKPVQFIDEPYLRALEEAGHAAGGKIATAAKNLILPPAENAARTQIIGTLPTYQKAADIFKQQGATGLGIDFGAGLGEGAKALGKDFHTYEPFAQNWAPTFSKAADVPSDAYGKLTNLNVLNVVPREVRDSIVEDIGRVMEPGGLGIITTRGKDVMNAKGLAGPEPMSIITSRDTYQKGFSKDELEDYMKYILGDKFDVNRLNLGPAGVLIQKKADGGSIQGYAPGGKIVKGALDALTKASEGKIGQVADKNLLTLQDFHTSLGDRIAAGVRDTQNKIANTEYKYNVGDRVFTDWTAKNNYPPMEILDKRLYGGSHSAFVRDPVTFKPVLDESGNKIREPERAGYLVKHEFTHPELGDVSHTYVLPEERFKGVIEPEPPYKTGGSV